MRLIGRFTEGFQNEQTACVGRLRPVDRGSSGAIRISIHYITINCTGSVAHVPRDRVGVGPVSLGHQNQAVVRLDQDVRLRENALYGVRDFGFQLSFPSKIKFFRTHYCFLKGSRRLGLAGLVPGTPVPGTEAEPSFQSVDRGIVSSAKRKVW
jgi:hypothetical protein